ncbi:hypothetical protein [Campylobacter sp. 2018MI13]|uniref:hypothetical protein n=1 Tax=Campylobacter sp. 2018MI13 TaxID=2836737 RepID=UPI001BDA970C|nr:hypothetical protein [Campylobacter sp. 2018MI13]MBT0882107.1 hypothetical protein [Campylobacter sp. 2018MI13]
MKKLVFSLICVNAFASNFVGLDIYGTSLVEENGVSLEDNFVGRADLYANRFYTNEENHFVYDIRFTHAEINSDFVNSYNVKGKIKDSFNSFSALGGYGILVGNDMSLSLLGGLGYASRSFETKFYNIDTNDINVSANSMFLKAGVAARKQFENNFTMSGGVYLKYFAKKVNFIKRFSPEVDLRLGYTFANNTYAGVKFGYENTLIGHGGKAGFELGYKF